VADLDRAARLARVPAAAKRVHLIGVGGTAMAALAGMLSDRGLTVTGSDNQLYEPTASLLRNSRVNVITGFAPANLSPPPDLAVVGNVIMRNNPEAQALLDTASFVIFNRPETALAPQTLHELGFAPARSRIVHLDTPAIAAHQVRDRLARGAPIDDLVPAAVADYIRTHELYRA